MVAMVVRVQHGDDRLRGQLGDARADRVALADEGHRVDHDHAVARHEHPDVAADAGVHVRRRAAC
jgi:hypothetical protein